MTARKAGNHHVWLSSLLYPHAAIVAGYMQCIAVSADSTLILSWQTYLCRHRNFPQDFNVAAGQLRIGSTNFFSLLEQNLHALLSYLLCVGPHFQCFTLKLRKRAQQEEGRLCSITFLFQLRFSGKNYLVSDQPDTI